MWIIRFLLCVQQVLFFLHILVQEQFWGNYNFHLRLLVLFSALFDLISVHLCADQLNKVVGGGFLADLEFPDLPTILFLNDEFLSLHGLPDASGLPILIVDNFHKLRLPGIAFGQLDLKLPNNLLLPFLLIKYLIRQLHVIILQLFHSILPIIDLMSQLLNLFF